MLLHCDYVILAVDMQLTTQNAESITSHVAIESAESAAGLQSAEARGAAVTFVQRRSPDFTRFC